MTTKNTGKLNVATPTDREIVITRVLDAPRNLVFDAMCKPELIQRWMLGAPGWAMPICESDVRAGGTFRYVWRDASGAEMYLSGNYSEVVPPKRVVRTESFRFGSSPHVVEQVTTLDLADKDGKTHLTLTVLYPSKEARDSALASGMDQGIAAIYDRLEGMLSSPTQ